MLKAQPGSLSACWTQHATSRACLSHVWVFEFGGNLHPRAKLIHPAGGTIDWTAVPRRTLPDEIAVRPAHKGYGVLAHFLKDMSGGFQRSALTQSGRLIGNWQLGKTCLKIPGRTRGCVKVIVGQSKPDFFVFHERRTFRLGQMLRI
jgi:hypothetical protein